MISRRSLLVGTGALAGGAGLALAAPPTAVWGGGGFDLRAAGGSSWIPAVGVQNGPVCSVWAVGRALSWWMGQKYGWRHTISLSYPSVLARAEKRPESTRMVRVAQDLNQTGWVFKQHPTTRLRAGYRVIGRDPDAIRRAVDAYRQPVAVSLWMPSQVASARLALIDQSTVQQDPTTSHAVWVCGYDSESLLFQNSWGTGWGDQGYGRVSDAWFKHYGGTSNIALTSVRVGKA